MNTQTPRTGDCGVVTSDTDSVVEMYSGLVYRLAFANVRNKSDADDIFQEVFLRYIRSGKSFESEDHRKAWFIRVTINCCKTFFTSAWNRGVGLDDIGEIPVEYDDTDKNELLKTVLGLPPKLRDVILLFYYENMPVKEIAGALRATEGSVKTRLTRARAELKEKLKGWYS